MTISVNTVFEVRPGGNETNGGGFVAGATGTDYSQQDNPQVTIDLVTNTATVNGTTLTFATNVPSSADVGNILQITGGTATAGYYQITNFSAGSKTWTLDRSAGSAGSTVVGRMGGALKSPGHAAVAASVGGNYIYVKSGTYTALYPTAGSGGLFKFSNNLSTGIEGYNNTRGDRGYTPYLTAAIGLSGVTLYSYTATGGNTHQHIFSMGADGNGQLDTVGFSGNNVSRNICGLSDARNFASGTSLGYSTLNAFSSRARNCAIGFNFSATTYCESYNCVSGFVATSAGGGVLSDCVAVSGGVGFQVSQAVAMINCGAFLNSSHGFSMISAIRNSNTLINCLAISNSGAGFYLSTNMHTSNCAGWNNNMGTVSGTIANFSGITNLTANPLTDLYGLDFRPNNAVGGGMAIRSSGIGFLSQQNNYDLGSVNHSHMAGIPNLYGGCTG